MTLSGDYVQAAASFRPPDAPSAEPGDWLETDMEFGEWFPKVLAGEIETDWMPE